mmetsp:Transcript_32397/g.100208  ORF Transcript_32397/g.100208 Transcript_32397/m.100208 type:complete len:422 (-) Transcript_32397:76-1341(-)
MRSFLAAATLLVALAVSGAAAGRPGVIIHAVGDSATAGDLATLGGGGKAGRFDAHLSYRRYLAHMLTAHGYNVRFVGSKDDCDAGAGLDFDSRHDGYAKGRVNDIRGGLNAGQSAIASSLQAAAQSLKDAGSPTINLVRVVMAGGEDAANGRGSKEISESDLKNLVETVEGLTNGGPSDINARYTLVIPSPPPGGVRTTDDSGKTTLQRDFQRDQRYEDYRFFLTWRGVFFDKKKNVADCLSYFDFLRHYNADGTRLNALGDQALARCVFDNLVARKHIPKVASHTPAAACDADTEKHVQRDITAQLPPYAVATDGSAAEPVLVNKALPPLTALVARAVRLDAPAVHPTCGASGAGGGAAKAKKKLAAEGDDYGAADSAPAAAAGSEGGGKTGKCLATPRFPEYEPFAETTKDLWKSSAAE